MTEFLGQWNIDVSRHARERQHPAVYLINSYSLHDEGLYTWPEWVETFSQQVLEALRQGDPDLGDTYYLHWLATLETLCT